MTSTRFSTSKVITVLAALVILVCACFGFAACGEQQHTVTFKNGTTVVKTITYKDGDTTLANIPDVPQGTDGFAGVWAAYDLSSNNDIEVQPVYGDGTTNKPHLVSNVAQFFNMLDTNSKAYLAAIAAYQEALKTDPTAQLVRPSYKNYKLINDIDFSNYNQPNKGVDPFYGALDGNGHAIIKTSNTTFANNDGAIIKRGIDTVFKNLTLKLGDQITSLLAYTLGDSCTFENITVENASGITATAITADDNNESPFLCHASATVTTFKNCTVNANFIAENYSALFVGGGVKLPLDYNANTTVKVVFDKCINNGEVFATDRFGLLVGNGSWNDKVTLEVKNGTKNNGKIHYFSNNHVGLIGVSSKLTDSSFTINANNGDIFGTGANSTLVAQTKAGYTLSKDANGKLVINKGTATTIAAGDFKIVFKGFARGTQTDDLSVVRDISILLNIESIIKNNAATSSFATNLTVPTFMDKTTYTDSGKTIKDDQVWTTNTNYPTIKYFFDETNGIYVFDLETYCKTILNITAPYTINLTPKTSVIVYSADGKMIDYLTL